MSNTEDVENVTSDHRVEILLEFQRRYDALVLDEQTAWYLAQAMIEEIDRPGAHVRLLYEDLERMAFALDAAGNAPDADAIRDALDVLWRKLPTSVRAQLNARAVA